MFEIRRKYQILADLRGTTELSWLTWCRVPQTSRSGMENKLLSLVLAGLRAETFATRFPV